MSKTLKFKSIDEIFHNAEKTAEAAFAHAITCASTEAVDESGQKYAVYFQCHPEQVALFEEALRRFPQHTELYAGHLGELHFDVGNLEKAEPYLENAISAGPISNPRIHIPLNHNMLAIIYLTQKKGEEARKVLIRGRERSSYRNAGTDALLSYAFLLSGNPAEAMKLSEEALDLFSKLDCPNCDVMAHDLAASVKARSLISGSEKVVEEYGRRMASFKDGVLRNLQINLDKNYGTTKPLELIELVPTSEFKFLKGLKYGSYHEPVM